jgi:hypothetical protein
MGTGTFAGLTRKLRSIIVGTSSDVKSLGANIDIGSLPLKHPASRCF